MPRQDDGTAIRRPWSEFPKSFNCNILERHETGGNSHAEHVAQRDASMWGKIRTKKWGKIQAPSRPEPKRLAKMAPAP